MAEILKLPVNHASGKKHPRANISLSTMVMETGGGADAPRTSSTPEPGNVEVVEMAASGDDFSMRPSVPLRQQRPATPTASLSGGLASLKNQQLQPGGQATVPAVPNVQGNVAQWVVETAAAAAGGAKQIGTAANPVIVDQLNEAQILIVNQQKQLEEMRRQLAASETSLKQRYDAAVEKRAKEAADAAVAQQQGEMRRVQEELMSERQQAEVLRNQMVEQRRQFE